MAESQKQGIQIHRQIHRERWLVSSVAFWEGLYIPGKLGERGFFCLEFFVCLFVLCACIESFHFVLDVSDSMLVWFYTCLYYILLIHSSVNEHLGYSESKNKDLISDLMPGLPGEISKAPLRREHLLLLLGSVFSTRLLALRAGLWFSRSLFSHLLPAVGSFLKRRHQSFQPLL